MKTIDFADVKDIDLSRINTIALSLTTFCNLDCKYCYARAGREGTHIPFKKVKTFLGVL